MVFDQRGRVVAQAQREHTQIFPRPGWVEHDPAEIISRTTQVIEDALDAAGLSGSDLSAVGITNQRETAVLWDRNSGEAVANAIVWQDTRTDEMCRRLSDAAGGPGRFQKQTGLPIATYFSGPKVSWLLDQDPALRRRGEAGDLAFGTIDSWLMWHLTGGKQHVTDVTNASRTLLMDLRDLSWSSELCDQIGVPEPLLAEIHPSVGMLAEATGPLAGVPIAGILGDQHAALFGQACFAAGDAKNTYGTGCFMLMNTGNDIVYSNNGLLTTLGYQIADEAPVYALEGSVAVAGALVQWLRDNLGIISNSAEVEAIAGSVEDNGDVYFVPAFSGLFAPHWRSDARGVVAGLTRFATRAHIARAALEATAFQSAEVLDAMIADSQVTLGELRVDGGMVVNDLLMQFQADIVGTRVIRPEVAETTALGAAYAAGLAVGVWSSLDEIAANWNAERVYEPQMSRQRRRHLMSRWQTAVERSLNWVN